MKDPAMCFLTKSKALIKATVNLGVLERNWALD